MQIASPRSFSGGYDNGGPAFSVIHWTFEAAAAQDRAIRRAVRKAGAKRPR